MKKTQINVQCRISSIRGFSFFTASVEEFWVLLFLNFFLGLQDSLQKPSSLLLSNPPKVSCYNEDFISSLPDDILVSILSRLSLKEAGLTSRLSRRWRYLWTSIAGLDFDADDKLSEIASEPKLKSCERSRYINWVSRVVRNYRGLTLEAFRICFDLERDSKSAIDNWIKFAIAKSVQRLELDLPPTFA
ncbi:hypothetical protein ACH5RR_019371 [Cinchona calisaya]|uniref:F-box domain-containing protein n=1 Tax=Cinchona calisaya TaxID=153742 RepID=A0ABD2ZSS9_9GENT